VRPAVVVPCRVPWAVGVFHFDPDIAGADLSLEAGIDNAEDL
jgi:hypothetical protein